jgi:hypothetical protein
MTALITLTTAGSDSGPFNLYSDLDGYTTAFETAVPKASLLAGYASSLVPDFTTVVRILSTGVCTNYIDVTLTTIEPTLRQGQVSLGSGPMSGDGCAYGETSIDCWVLGTGDINESNIVYTDSGATTLFVGNGEFYSIILLEYSIQYSAPIDSSGVIQSGITVCPA